VVNGPSQTILVEVTGPIIVVVVGAEKVMGEVSAITAMVIKRIMTKMWEFELKFENLNVSVRREALNAFASPYSQPQLRPNTKHDKVLHEVTTQTASTVSKTWQGPTRRNPLNNQYLLAAPTT
jgi:hypothetical protein